MASGKYAVTTTVPADKSRADIEKIVRKYGADMYGYATTEDKALITFRMRDRHLRFELSFPSEDDRSVTHTEQGKTRTATQANNARDQLVRQRWRALLILIQGKLEAVEVGIEVFDAAFMPNIVLPDNSLVGDFMVPQIEAAYSEGAMPPLLPFFED